MRCIPLIRGKFAIIDDEDFDFISMKKWRVNAYGYAIHTGWANGKSFSIMMHRHILKLGSGMDVDHINGDKLDNRKENLRVCLHKENLLNKKTRKDSHTGFKGVTFMKNRSRPYRARVKKDGICYALGYYETPELAHMAYCKKAIELHGEFFNKG